MAGKQCEVWRQKRCKWHRRRAIAQRATYRDERKSMTCLLMRNPRTVF